MRRVTRALAILILAFGFDQWLERLFPDNWLLESITSIPSVYDFFSSSRAALPLTTIIELSPETSRDGVSLLTACRERAFFGALLTSLSKRSPKVVVLDKWFKEETCKTVDPITGERVYDSGTKQLIAGMQALCNRHTIVVVGRAIDEEARTKPGFVPPYPLEPAVNFKKEGCTCVQEGILNIDLDVRRVALWWTDVEGTANTKPPPPSLALLAAMAIKQTQSARNSELASWPSDSNSPFIRFLRVPEFDSTTVAARNFVCGREPWRGCQDGELPRDALCGKPGAWRPCKDDDVAPSVDSNPLIIIGEKMAGYDEFETPVGRVFGYILQANSISALTYNRTIRPVAEWINILAGMVIFIGFEFMLWYHEATRIWAILYSLLVLIAAFLFVYLLLNLATYYPDPKFSCLVILGSRIAELFLPDPPHEAVLPAQP